MPEPYLSLVATARNDDHGGNLLGRMQIFVDGWLAQARRYNVSSELILVEWNPPADRPPLAKALKWPSDFGPCEIRVITVPPEIHNRYQHAASLPLYQMIAKNVGIRRARGQFILATNIDILFSDELAAFLGKQQLRTDRMYRIDRHDAMSDVPAAAPIEEQLAYCRTHLIRVNRREGTFDIAPDGRPVLSPQDAASAGSGILFGPGWFSPERFGPVGSFRWAQEQAELLLEPSPESNTQVTVDLEPGPAAGGRPLELEVRTPDGNLVAQFTMDTRSLLRITLPAPTPRFLTLRALGTFQSPNVNPRPLCFRVFRVERGPMEAPETPEPSPVPPQATLNPASTSRRMLLSWRSLQYVIGKLAYGGPLVPLTVPVSPRLGRMLRKYVERGGVTGMIRGVKAPPPVEIVPAPAPIAETPQTPQTPQICCPDFLHTNGCGDFTLIAREQWFNLRGYPEFDIFSMNLDSVFCFAAHYGGAHEEVLEDPVRIYHIEHGSGSGWTPEGQQKLYQRLAAKNIPVLDNEEVLRWGAQMRRLSSPMIFNREDWGLSTLELDETMPNSGHAGGLALDAEVLPSLRGVAPELRGYSVVHQTGSEIAAGLLSAASTLASVRPLVPYPGWRFDSDWDRSQMEIRMRRFIWTYFHNEGRGTPLQIPWHKGLTIQIHLGNDLSRPLFVGGCIDPNEFAFLDSILQEGMVFIDVGANEGLYSLFAARCVGPSGRVFSFEPSEREFQRLNCNVRLNGLGNVRAVQAALAEAAGEIELRIASTEHAGQNTLGTFIYEVPLLRTERVAAQTLDGFAAASGLTRIDVIKLDVEGAERRVLEGSRRVLREMRPIILFEASDRALKAQGGSLANVLEFLSELDYAIYTFDKRTGMPAPADVEGHSDNMIAVPKDRRFELERPKPRCHPVFETLPVDPGETQPGFETDFLGIRTRCEFSAGAILTAMPVHISGPHEDYFEWIDLVESILAAKERYTMMELGAGYGRWSVRAAVLARKLRQLPSRLVAVEGEPRHYRWLQQHMSDNRIHPPDCTLIQGVVSDHRDDVLFYVGSPSGESNQPASWYGQAIVPRQEEAVEPASGSYECQDLVQLKSGWSAVKAHSYLLTDILPETGRIDLMDMDIQGEELKVISASIDTLDRRVARLHIGTHSRDIEAGLRQLLGQHGWQNRMDYPGAQTSQTQWGPIDFVDGVQSWINPSLIPESSAD